MGFCVVSRNALYSMAWGWGGFAGLYLGGAAGELHEPVEICEKGSSGTLLSQM